MAKCTCAISGLRFNTNFCDSLSLPANEGFPHPIFAAPKKYLTRLYSAHTRGNLNATDSYLLFMALLHSSESITWQHPAVLNPQEPATKALIENNIAQLMSVLERTDAILHPSFEQPKFIVSYDNAKLSQIPNWIKAWELNIASFHTGRADQTDIDRLNLAEARLSKLILSEQSPEHYTKEIATWASRAGQFPKDKDTEWQEVIKSCFNITKMFNTPLATIKEVKAFCEENIEVGSIHFHTLHKVLVEGINRHVDYLGGSSLALGYELLAPSSTERPNLVSLSAVSEVNESHKAGAVSHTKQLIAEQQLQDTISGAPKSAPLASNYPNAVAFLRAKLAYRVAQEARAQEAERAKALALKATIESTKESL